MSPIEIFSADIEANEPNQSVIPTNSNHHIFKFNSTCYSRYFNGYRFSPRVMVEWGIRTAYLPDLANWQAHHATAPLQMTPFPPMHHLPLRLEALINCNLNVNCVTRRILCKLEFYHSLSFLLSLLYGSCTFRGPSDTLPMKQLEP